MKTNTVYVTDDANDLSLEKAEFGLESLHWIGDEPELGKTYDVRIRHRGALTKGKLVKGHRIELSNPERAVAVGQSAVLYDEDVVLGGGIITD
jgi:tRNA-specific 2-thiouridylase